uniref:Uncharacterized protein n=1 Tax=Anopheles dirus TaxID=7168 RepID=A0A182NCH5_9DIPT
MMAHIQDMTQQSKVQVLLNVVELNVKHVQQRQQIAMLQTSIRKVMEDRVQTKKDLIVQHNFKKSVDIVEEQKQSATVRLRERLESVNAHIKSNEVLRLQLRDDDVRVRSGMEDVKRLAVDLTDTAKSLQRSLEMGSNRMKEMNQQLNSLTKENAKLQDECRAKGSEMKTTATSCADIVQKTKQELAATEEGLKRRTEELKREQQRMAEQTKACAEQQAEKDTLQHEFNLLQQSFEDSILDRRQCFAEQEERLNKSYEEMKTAEEHKIATLSQKVQDMIDAKHVTEENIDALKAKQTNLAEQLQAALDRNKELENAIKDYDHNKHLEKELEMLKETMTIREQPNRFLQGKRKEHTFFKARNGNDLPKPTETIQEELPPISIISDSDVGFVLPH